MLNDEKRTVEEAYTSAMTTSNLRVEADRTGDGDVIIAAGWNQVRIGGALLRLHTEFDASEKPRMASWEAFYPGIQATATAGGAKPTKEDREKLKLKAHQMALEYNLHEMGLLLGKLKALPDVRMQTTLQLLKWGFEDAESKAVQILRWWLAQNCQVCQGTKFQVVQGTNRLSNKACKACAGTGLRAIPHGQEGRRCASWLDQCVERARASIQSRLRPARSSAE